MTKILALLMLFCSIGRAEDRMPDGPFEGQPIDTTERRSVRILTAAEAAPYAPGPGDVVIANFYHTDPRYPGKFWVAKVPADAVDNVIFESWNFSWLSKKIPILKYIPTAAHNEIRFQLKPGMGMTLYPQESAGPPLDHTVSDFVFSVEAVGPKGVGFSFSGGVGKHFIAAHRLKSIEASYYERVVRDREKVKQYRLDLDPKTKQDLLLNALAMADGAGMHTMYHLYKKSCTTEAYRLIDRTLKYGPLTGPMQFFHRIPIFPYTYLRLRHLVDRKSVLPTLNDENKGDCKRWLRGVSNPYR